MKYQQRLIDALFNPPQISERPLENESSLPALKVYSNNYIESGIRALSITYRTVLALISEESFRSLAAAYIHKYPKTCFDWADYGEYLSDFMFDIDEFANMPFLPELAAIDWRLLHIERAQNEVFDAASFGLLQTHNMEQLFFKAAPGLQTLNVLFPVHELYQLAHDMYEQGSATTAQEAKKLRINKINILVNDAINSKVYRSIVLWREEYKGLFEYTDANALNAFASMQNNECIAKVLSHFGEDQSAMTNWLQQHIQSKKIYAVLEG
jgi:hypothetical protein